jgi:glycosyltransferase involved in cell wall biosynthesis
MEAQTQSVACVATRVSAIPELIEHGVTGLLVEPDAPEPLAGAIRKLIEDPPLRLSLGRAGRTRVIARFALDANIEQLAKKFGLGHPRPVVQSGSSA